MLTGTPWTTATGAGLTTVFDRRMRGRAQLSDDDPLERMGDLAPYGALGVAPCPRNCRLNRRSQSCQSSRQTGSSTSTDSHGGDDNTWEQGLAPRAPGTVLMAEASRLLRRRSTETVDLETSHGYTARASPEPAEFQP
jgi:hypothetical protein